LWIMELLFGGSIDQHSKGKTLNSNQYREFKLLFISQQVY
jgi:hypothetical protein